MAQYAKMPAGKSRSRRREYIYTEGEIRTAAYTIGFTFLLTLAIVVVTGVVALAYAPRADIDFAELGDDAACLRVARRADYTVVYMDVGSPMQRVNLLLDLETAVAPGGESLSIFSSRLHKSVSMACGDLSPHRQYAQLCHDLALVAPNGSASDQQLMHTTFVFENDQAAYAERQPASIAGLDGTFRLTRGQTVWLSTTHLCFAPVRPTPTDHPLLLFDVDAQDKLRTRMIDLDVFDPEFAFDDRCAEALEHAPVRLFPIEAANEARVWLTLSGLFLYEYGSDVLEKRRRVVEAGENCSALIRSLRTSATSTTPTVDWASARARCCPRCPIGAWPRAGSASTCRSTARAASSQSTPPRFKTSSRPTRTRSPRRARACSCCCSRPRWSSCAARRTPPRRAGS